MDFGVSTFTSGAVSGQVNHMLGWGTWTYIFGIVIVALLLPELFSVFSPILEYFRSRHDHANTLGNYVTFDGRSKWMSDDKFGDFVDQNRLSQVGEKMRRESWVKVDYAGVEQMRVEREMHDVVRGKRK